VLAVFVNRENPLSAVTLTQLDAIFGADFRRGSKIIRTWGDLGLNGSWSNKPIQRYGFNPANDEFARFFEDAVMVEAASGIAKCTDLATSNYPTGRCLRPGSRSSLPLLRTGTRFGYSSLLYRNTQVKPLALAPAMRRDRFGSPMQSGPTSFRREAIAGTGRRVLFPRHGKTT